MAYTHREVGQEAPFSSETAAGGPSTPVHTMWHNASRVLWRGLRAPTPGPVANTDSDLETSPTIRFADLPGPSVREMLAARREALGLSYDMLEKELKIRADYLQAVETMDVKSLPSKGHAIAFLMAYARRLGLDAETIVEKAREERATAEATPVSEYDIPKDSVGRPNQLGGMILGALGVVALVFGARAVLDAAPADQKPAIIQTAGTVDAALPEMKETVSLRAVTEAWLEVRTKTGSVLLSRELKPGEVAILPKGVAWQVFARDGGAFEVFADGVGQGALGRTGNPVSGWRFEPRPAVEVQPVAGPAATVVAPAATSAAIGG